MRAARVDANAPAIVAALRRIGAVVRVIRQGEGIPDLLVGYRGQTVLVEVKDGAKPPSARRLTPDEQRFFDEWTGGPCVIVNSVEEAIQVVQSLVVAPLAQPEVANNTGS